MVKLLRQLDKYCKQALQPVRGTTRSGFEVLEEEFRTDVKHILSGLLRAFLRPILTDSTLEQCSTEVLRFGTLIRIMQVMCLSVGKPQYANDLKVLWKDCYSVRSLTFDEARNAGIILRLKELER